MITIRALAPSDDRSSFYSGEPALDAFFTKYAGQNQFKLHIGTTYVALSDERIVGYATVSPASISIDDLPPARRKRLPAYPLPVLRLARLAVDESARGLGIGKALLRYVFGVALRMSEDLGCIGVLVDAKPDAVAFYEQYGFSPLDLVAGQSQARPEPRAMFLSTKEIASAAK